MAAQAKKGAAIAIILIENQDLRGHNCKPFARCSRTAKPGPAQDAHLRPQCYFLPNSRRRTLKARACPRPYVRNWGEPEILFTTFGFRLLVRLLNPKRHAHK